MKVCFIAAPLMARSGVYRTVYDHVAEGKARGLDWTAVIGLRPDMPGQSPLSSPEVDEFTVNNHGIGVISELQDKFETHPYIQSADVLITLITQTDIAVSKMSRKSRWVVFVRGLPWPDANEQTWIRRIAQKRYWTNAVQKADDIWATTNILSGAISGQVSARIVPAGVPARKRISDGHKAPTTAVWAGRFDKDKRPDFFNDIMQSSSLKGEFYGQGPLEQEIEAHLPPNVTLRGWVEPDALWSERSLFIGTSKREAFGRSAVEAALRGLPVVISTDYGCADSLYTDPDLRDSLVLPLSDPRTWRNVIHRIADDEEFRIRISDHVYSNAMKLTISSAVDRILPIIDIYGDNTVLGTKS